MSDAQPPELDITDALTPDDPLLAHLTEAAAPELLSDIDLDTPGACAGCASAASTCSFRWSAPASWSAWSRWARLSETRTTRAMRASCCRMSRHLGATSVDVREETTVVDRRRLWRNWVNVWHNAGIRSVFWTVANARASRSDAGAVAAVRVIRRARRAPSSAS